MTMSATITIPTIMMVLSTMMLPTAQLPYTVTGDFFFIAWANAN